MVLYAASGEGSASRTVQRGKDKDMDENISKKKTERSLKILYIILGVCVAGVLTFGIWLGVELYKDWQMRDYFTALAASVEMRPRQPNSPGANPSSGSNIEGGGEGEVNADESYEPWVSFVDFEELNKRFPGAIGWIILDGTPINYPIMQYTDNNFFLYHRPDGSAHRSGSIFMDYRNTADFTDRNTLLYGHMNRTGDMFGILRNYREQAFFEEHPVLYIHTPTTDYRLFVFAAYLVHAVTEQPRMIFQDDDDFEQYIQSIVSGSLIRSDILPTAQDRIVTLATCAYDFDDARLVIVGKLERF